MDIDMDLIVNMLESSNQTYQESEDQSKVWLGWTVCNAMVKGKLEIQDTMDRWGGEVWVEGLALMDRGNGEGHVKRLWSDRPHMAEKL